MDTCPWTPWTAGRPEDTVIIDEKIIDEKN
jgi:hypothetical protein